VEAEGREVASWDQPIIQQRDPGIIGFILRRIEGAVHFLVQLKMESGNIDLLGVAPTVQCITGSYHVGELPPYVSEMLKPTRSHVVLDTMQSEEGGRFFLESNRNLLLLAADDFPLDTPPRYLWLSLRQMKQLLAYNNFLNVEARSLLALI
jgi:oxidase EvaA